MSYQLRIRHEAHEDIIEVYEYYEEKSRGLGERFLQELTKRYNNIIVHPEYYGFIDDIKLSGMLNSDIFPI